MRIRTRIILNYRRLVRIIAESINHFVFYLIELNNV